jgi:hypothetical protein
VGNVDGDDSDTGCGKAFGKSSGPCAEVGAAVTRANISTEEMRNL